MHSVSFTVNVLQLGGRSCMRRVQTGIKIADVIRLSTNSVCHIHSTLDPFPSSPCIPCVTWRDAEHGTI